MKKTLKATQNKLSALKVAIVTMFYMMMGNAHAALPDIRNPTNAAADGDYIALMQGYAYDILILGGLLIASIAFYSVAGNVIATYKEIGAGKKTWGDMGMQGLFGVLLLVFVVFLTTEASTIIF